MSVPHVPRPYWRDVTAPSFCSAQTTRLVYRDWRRSIWDFAMPGQEIHTWRTRPVESRIECCICSVGIFCKSRHVEIGWKNGICYRICSLRFHIACFHWWKPFTSAPNGRVLASASKPSTEGNARIPSRVHKRDHHGRVYYDKYYPIGRWCG